MKLFCATSKFGRIAAVLLFAVLSASSVFGTQSLYQNTGNITWLGPNNVANTVPFLPQVDATNFYNSGTWNIVADSLGVSPYRASHTLNYTNIGSMFATTTGWELDYGPL